MCGIAGAVGEGAQTLTPLVDTMMARLAHRGPDDAGLWAEPDVALGHRRLSILDLTSAGRQPMASADGRYTITYNGEIYNYVELRDALRQRGHAFRTETDTEVLLAAYAEWGDACLEHLNGMWAFALWDRRRHRLFAARDRFGEKPFYYVLHGPRLYFASEIKALLAIPDFSRTVNSQAVVDFCAERMVDRTAETWIREIRQLPPATTLVWEAQRMTTAAYWALPPQDEGSPRTAGGAEHDALRALLEDAVRLRLRAHTPVGCLVSGGLDSSAIACLARIHYPANRRIALFTTRTDPPTPEAEGIEQFLVRGGFELHAHTPTAQSFWEDLPAVLRHQEQPFADGSMAAHYALMRTARQASVPVLLSGQGADEVFAGYPSYLWVALGRMWGRGRWGRALCGLREAAAHQPVQYRSVLFHALPRAVRGAVRRAALAHRTRWINPSLLRDLTVREASLDGADSLHAYARQAITACTLPGFLHYEDRNAMAFGVETRLPFLDHRLVEHLFRMPADQWLEGGVTKSLLRHVARPVVPHPIVERTAKQGYPAPLAQWLRTLDGPVRDVASSGAARGCPLLDYRRWRTALDAFLAGHDHALDPAWRGLLCVMWYDQVFRAR